MTRNTVPGRFGRHGRALVAGVGVLGAAAVLSAAVASATAKTTPTTAGAGRPALLVKPVSTGTGVTTTPPPTPMETCIEFISTASN